MGMKELTDKEIQWLEAFAKKHEFFASFLLHYKLKNGLSNNQYYWLHLYINQAEEQGETILPAKEIKFMEEFSERDDPLSEILKIYEDKGFLDKSNYEAFLEIKLNITGKAGKAEKSKSVESGFKHKVVKIPCPHCNFLCSPQIQFCKKCGEPLPKLEKFDGFSGISDVSDVDYAERNIIHSLEKLINKSIPLSEKFNMSTTCYVKGGEEITGLSIFNCGLKAFSSEILRLKSLKHLALRRNNLGHLPKDIGFLSTLEYLDLRINNLETLPNALGLLIKLENLNVSSNKLKAIPDSIGNLLMLIKINFSGNILKTIPITMENLHSLKTLNLQGNYWIDIPETVKKLESEGLEIVL